jgi:hypothetical protein
LFIAAQDLISVLFFAFAHGDAPPSVTPDTAPRVPTAPAAASAFWIALNRVLFLEISLIPLSRSRALLDVSNCATCFTTRSSMCAPNARELRKALTPSTAAGKLHFGDLAERHGASEGFAKPLALR